MTNNIPAIFFFRNTTVVYFLTQDVTHQHSLFSNHICNRYAHALHSTWCPPLSCCNY